MTPLNTGKVLIGSCYMQAMPHQDKDADRLQAALLGDRFAVWNMPKWARRLWSWL